MATCTYSINGLEQMYSDLDNARNEMQGTLDTTNDALSKAETDLTDAEAELETAEAEAEAAEAEVAEAEAAAASVPAVIEKEEIHYTTNDKGQTIAETVIVTVPNPAYATAQAKVGAAKSKSKAAKAKVSGAKNKVQGLKDTIKDMKTTIENLEQSIKDTGTYMKTVDSIISTVNKADEDVSELLITINWSKGSFTYGDHNVQFSNYGLPETMYEGGLFGAEYFATIAEGCAIEVKDGFHFYTLKIGDDVVQFPLEAFSPTGDINDIPDRLSDSNIIEKLKSVESSMGINGKGAVQRLMADLGMSAESYKHYLLNNSPDKEKYQNMSEAELQELLDTYSGMLERSARTHGWATNSNWTDISHVGNGVRMHTGDDILGLGFHVSSQKDTGRESACGKTCFYAVISSVLGYDVGKTKIPGDTNIPGSDTVDGVNFDVDRYNGYSYKSDSAADKVTEGMNKDNVDGVLVHYFDANDESHFVVVQNWNGDWNTSTFWDPYYGKVVTGIDNCEVAKRGAAKDSMDIRFITHTEAEEE